jgi:hypothetical protein
MRAVFFLCVNIMFWWFEGVAAAPLLRAILCARVHPLHGFPPVSVAGAPALLVLIMLSEHRRCC